MRPARVGTHRPAVRRAEARTASARTLGAEVGPAGRDGLPSGQALGLPRNMGREGGRAADNEGWPA